MINKVTTLERAMEKVHDGDTILVGGFLKCGHPQMLTGRLADMNVRDLTIVSMCTGTTECNLYKVFTNGQVSKVIGSYIRFNPVTVDMVLKNDGSVTILPMGTFAERIRAGGSGLGGWFN